MKIDGRTSRQTIALSGSSGTPQEQSTIGGVRILNEVERAWLAGIVDGEGSIFIVKLTPRKRPRYRRGFFYRPELGVANSNPELLARIRKMIGKGYFGLDKQRDQNPNWNNKWQYKGSGLVLRGILPQILPYLTVKRQVAEAMLRYLDFVDKDPIDGPKRPPPGYDEQLDSLYMAVKKLNGRGPGTSANDEFLPPWGPKHRGRGGRATGCRTLNEQAAAWLAGVVDGEGSIFLSKVMDPRTRRGFYYRPEFTVSNTNRFLLIKVAEAIGEGTVYFAKKGDARTKSRWMYAASSGVLRAVLPQILPFLIVKKARAMLMLQLLEFIDSNPIRGIAVAPSYYEKLDVLYLAMKKLNQKGRGAGIL